MNITVNHFSIFINYSAPTEIYTLSLHDALPILTLSVSVLTPQYSDLETLRATFTPATPGGPAPARITFKVGTQRSEEHTSELQSRRDLVCRLLLEKKKI